MCCISASGVVLPPLMIYPRKREVPEKSKEGAVPGTMFRSSKSGWMTADIFYEWFQFFIRSSTSPTARPVLLIMDGHASHVTMMLLSLPVKMAFICYASFSLIAHFTAPRSEPQNHQSKKPQNQSQNHQSMKQAQNHQSMKSCLRNGTKKVTMSLIKSTVSG